MFPLRYIPQILYTASRNKGPIIPAKFFSYDLPVNHSTFVTQATDGRTNDRRQRCQRRKPY